MLESEVTEVTEVMASGRKGQTVRGHPPKLSENSGLIACMLVYA